MKILVDMNFSPEWLKVLEQAGWQANHWTAVGSRTALEAGALLVIDEHRARLRRLPIEIGGTA